MWRFAARWLQGYHGEVEAGTAAEEDGGAEYGGADCEEGGVGAEEEGGVGGGVGEAEEFGDGGCEAGG